MTTMTTFENKMGLLDNVLITIFIILTAGLPYFVNHDWFTILIFISTLVIFLLKKCSFDIGFFIVIGVWLIINIMSVLINDRLDFFLLIGSILKMSIPYFIVKILKNTFFEKFFNYCFSLSIISSLFYLIEVLFPDFVTSLTPYLNFWVEWRMKAHNDFYIFVYTHLEHNKMMYGPFPRNSGFMWEPGAYALVIVFLIVYYANKTNFKFDRKMFFLFVILLSTFSTSGYLAFLIIIIYFMFKNESLRKNTAILPLIISFIVAASVITYKNADFMSEKINQYGEQGTTVGTQVFNSEKWKRVSRLGMGIISIENSLVHPFGDGVLLSNYIENKYGNVMAPSALSELLKRWGWLGLFFFLFSLWNCSLSSRERIGSFMLLTLPILLFSNPYERCQYLMFSIFYYSIICRNFLPKQY